MILFLYFGVLAFVLMLLVLALATARIPGWTTQRMIIGVPLLLVSAIGGIAVQRNLAERRGAFAEARWAPATVVAVEYGQHALPWLTFRVATPSCEFEFREQVSIDFADELGCDHRQGCPENTRVQVALGTPQCSAAYADPRAGVFIGQALTGALVLGGLAGLLFAWSGWRHSRGKD